MSDTDTTPTGDNATTTNQDAIEAPITVKTLSVLDLTGINFANTRDLALSTDDANVGIEISDPEKRWVDIDPSLETRVKYAFVDGDKLFGIVTNGPLPILTVTALLTNAPKVTGFKRYVMTGGFGIVNAAPGNDAHIYVKDLMTGDITASVINFGTARGADVQFDETPEGTFYAYGTGILGMNTSVTYAARQIEFNLAETVPNTPQAEESQPVDGPLL